MKFEQAEELSALVSAAKSILIIQADNPDADSLASALTLEQILGEQGKQVHLYCGVKMADYLQYIPGWDRVDATLPKQFDLSIIVDTSAISLLEILNNAGQLSIIRSKPSIVIDHHDATATIAFATVLLNRPDAAATGEVIYELAEQLNWRLDQSSRELITTSIMADSMGLTNDGTTARTIRIISVLVEQGVSLSELEQRRRALMHKPFELLQYKSQLLQRIELDDSRRIASVSIPWSEIEQFSYLYNPSMLIMEDMRSVTGVGLAIAFKSYPDGRVTAKIRANYGSPVAGDLAEHFGGGGHQYSSGFKVTGRPLNEIHSECLLYANELLDKLKETT